MRDKFGCHCCGFDCVVSTGDVDGVACAGTWARNGASHSTANANALWHDNTPLPDTVTAWQVTVRATIELDISAPPYSYGNCDVRVVGGLLDCQNYLFFELIQRRPPPGNPISYFQIRLGRVVAGVEEILAEHSRGGHCPGSISEEGYPLANGSYLYLCWDGQTLSGGLAYGAATLASRLTTPPPGRLAGVATGQVSVAARNVIFSELAHSRAETDDSEGTPCGDCGDHCCGGQVPAGLWVEIGGTIGGTWVFGVNGACVGSCDVVLGTFYLPAVSSPLAGGSTDCPGDGYCRWETNYTAEDILCTPIGIDPDYYTLNAINLLAVAFVIAGRRYLAVYVSHSGGCQPLVASLDLTPDTCEHLTDWRAMTVYNPDVSGCGCDVSGTTVRVKVGP